MLVVPKDEVIIISSNVPEIDDGIEVYDKDKTYKNGNVVQTEDCIFESTKDENIDVPIKEKTPLRCPTSLANVSMGVFWLYKCFLKILVNNFGFFTIQTPYHVHIL